MPSLTRYPPPALQALATALRPGRPTHISSLLQLLSNEDGFRWFRATVENLMPENAASILSHPEYPDMVRAFRQEFENRYLPLDEAMMESLAEDDPLEEPWDSLRHCVPIQLHGFIIEDPHEYAEMLARQWIRPGTGLMTLLFSSGRISWEPDEAVKLTWMEACTDIVPARILGRIPLEGFEATHIVETFRVHGMTDLENLALWIDSETPYTLLNHQYHPELLQELDFPWDRELIQDAGEQWREAEVFLQSVERGQEWIETDPPQRLNLIVSILLNNYYPWAQTQTE